MQLLCLFAQIDTVMMYYDKLIPHVCVSLSLSLDVVLLFFHCSSARSRLCSVQLS